MLKQTWYAVLAADHLTTTPVKTSLLHQDLVLFRDKTGQPHAFSAYCPHRGCDLSRGSVADDQLICPFHGWRFDPAGRCTHIPANRPHQPIPPTAHLIAYPVCEGAGLIWVYADPADAAPPALELFPELTSPDWHGVPFAQLWRANFCRVVESVLDVSHLPFVHPETTGRDVIPMVEGPEYDADDNRIVIYPTPFAPAHPMVPMAPPPETELRTEIELLFPNRWIIRTPMGHQNWMCTFLTFTPLDDGKTHIFGLALRNFQPESEWLDAFHLQHTEFVMRQDQEIIECLRPIIPPHPKAEAHVPSDGPTIRFRAALFRRLRDQH